MSHKVSIIIPVYNAEKYLTECLDSVIDQSYQNLDVLLVDDGSSDNSLPICKRYESQDKRVRVLTGSNGGVSKARNRGLKNASGDYIMFVDSDDIVERDTVEKLLNIIQSNDVDISMCKLTRFSNNTRPTIVNSQKYETNILSRDEALKKLLYQNGIVAGPYCKLIKKELFNEVSFQEGVKFAEDLDVTYQLISKSKNVALATFIGYLYRIHSTSAMGSAFSEDRMAGLDVCKSIYQKTKKYDHFVQIAAANRLFMEAIFILITIPFMSKSYKQQRKLCWNIVKQQRKIIIKDKMNPLMTSIVSAYLSLFGEFVVIGTHKIRRLMKSV